MKISEVNPNSAFVWNPLGKECGGIMSLGIGWTSCAGEPPECPERDFGWLF